MTMKHQLMSREDYSEFESRIEWRFVSAIKELDAYISEEEMRYGEIIITRDETPRCQPNISKSLTDLKAALKRDKIEREGAYEYIKKSNKTMKNILGKLKDEMKLCRENIRVEFINFDNLNTERLLRINPRNLVAKEK